MRLTSRTRGTNDTRDRLRAALAPRYLVEDQIAAGGMAVVLRAHDTRHDRTVAIKILHGAVGEAVGAERFLQEIAIAAKLAHPHILPLLDSGDADGLLYYVMPWVPGDTLRERIVREGTLPLADALELVRQVASALAHAHAAGVVHRDIKPENILMVDGQAVVADFGMAAVVRDPGASRLTGGGLAVGTLEYMAPEQAMGRDVDARADQYALACVLYEMLAGQPPFAGEPHAILAHHVTEPPPPLRRTLGVPPGTEAAMRKALAKAPTDRFPDIAVFAHTLSAAPRVARPRWRLAVLGALVLAVLGFGLWRVATRALPLGPRDWVLVGDFAAPDDDRALGRAIRELVVAGLNAGGAIATVPPEQVTAALRAAERPETTTVDATLARELAARTAVRVILTGSVSRIGRETWSLTLHANAADDGAPLFSEATSARDEGDQLVRSAEALVSAARRRLLARRDELQPVQPLLLVRTGSFPAFRRYAAAIELVRAGRWGASLPLFHEAVALDTAFAAAWAAMGSAYLTARQPDSATWAFRRALAHADRLSDVERYRLEGDAALQLRRDPAEALRWWDLARAAQPHSAPIHNNRGLVLSALGRHAEARDAFATALTIDPLAVGPRQIQLLNLVAELVVLGERDSAERAGRRLTGAPAAYARLLLLGARDDWVRARSVAESLAADPATESYVRVPAITLHAGALAALGRGAAADTVLWAAAERWQARTGDARWYAQAALLLARAEGRAAPPLPEALRRDTTPGGILLTGLAAAGAQPAVARSAVRRLAALPDAQRRTLGWGPAYLAALLAAGAGRWDSVLVLLDDAVTAGEHDPFSLDRPSSVAIRWLAAEALAATGRRDSAIALLQRTLAPVGIPPAHMPLRALIWRAGRDRVTEWRALEGRRPTPRASAGALIPRSLPRRTDACSLDGCRARRGGAVRLRPAGEVHHGGDE